MYKLILMIDILSISYGVAIKPMPWYPSDDRSARSGKSLVLPGNKPYYLKQSQRTYDVIITSLLRQNDVATSLRRDNYVIITSCVHWDVPWRHMPSLWAHGLTKISWLSTHWDWVRQNCRHFTDNIFKCIFLNENVWISIKISPNVVLTGSNNNIPALVQIMAWQRPGDEPLSEEMMVGLLTHICVSHICVTPP